MLSRFTIRWRLALISAALTFVILCGFAVAIGQLTVSRIRSDFSNETTNAATELGDRLAVRFSLPTGTVFVGPDLRLYAAPNDARIRVFDGSRRLIAQTPGAPDLGPPLAIGTTETSGYRRVTRFRFVPVSSDLTVPVWIEYARPIADVNDTVARVRLFLFLGVFGGTLLALMGGLALARRSLRPVTDITATAREIARTGDAALQVPQPRSDDEVAELARTFDEMLSALESARIETEGALNRQREFVADASHELRTPLTSVLANLEMLADELAGEPREAAESALGSARRMRRLVADLLLLARSETDRRRATATVDLGRIALRAVTEAHALAGAHEITADAREGILLEGVGDELHRLVLNLIENAIHHTPDGTTIRVSVTAAGDDVVLTVADDGPGVPADLRERIFDRFVSAAGDRGGSTGLGLAIVRAVARDHGGDVALEDSPVGARFVVRLPRAPVEASGGDPGSLAANGFRPASEVPPGPPPHSGDDMEGAAQTSTTTGRTIGRLRRRS